MTTDSFKWLPRSIAGYYRAMQVPEPEEIPWAPLRKPIEQCRFALVTTAGIYVKGDQQPFDVERERRQPFWGDPTYRVIPADVRQDQIGVTHLHVNTADIEQDMNVALPVHRFQELARSGAIGGVASHHYSFMGYQEEGATAWRDQYGPEIAKRMVRDEVDAVLLAPA